MYRYKRILVCLDFSDRDEYVIKMASVISNLACSDKVYFCHISKTLDLPDEVKKHHDTFLEPIDEFIKDKMQDSIKKHFIGPKTTKVRCEVREGSRLLGLLRMTVRKEIDLVITGKKLLYSGGTIPDKLTRKSPCSVLIVPVNIEANIERILVPVDFSKHSNEAMEIAIRYALASGQSIIYAIHTFSLPSGYYKTGKNEEEFANAMKNNAENEYRHFINTVDLNNIDVKINFVLDEKPVKAIQKEIDRLGIHLVVVGARGRNFMTSVLLGSITEKLIHNLNVPVIAVKEKGETLSFLDWMKIVTVQEN